MRSQYGDQSRVFLTEVGAPTSGGNSVTEPQQRDIILRQTAKHLEQPEVDGVFIHTLHNASSNSMDREANFGVFRFDDSPKPAACALGSLILGVTPDGC
jgi:exo-beta-1,3-glucanase (GH17 family)